MNNEDSIPVMTTLELQITIQFLKDNTILTIILEEGAKEDVKT